MTPPLAEVATLTAQEERLYVAIYDTEPHALDDIRETVPAFARVKPTTLERYARNLADKLAMERRGTIEFGRSVTHGKWVRLNRAG